MAPTRHALPRRTFLAALPVVAAIPALTARPARAASKGGENFVKLTPIAVEYWDQAGIFHAVNMELTVVFPGEAKMDKSVVAKITNALTAMAWEDFTRGNPAATIKGIALDIVRKQPGGEKASDVLVIKLLLR